MISVEQHLRRVADFAGLSDQDMLHLSDPWNINPGGASHIVENVITTMAIPVCIPTNLKIDGEDILVPMTTEEARITPAVGNVAWQCYGSGGLTTSGDFPHGRCISAPRTFKAPSRRAYVAARILYGTTGC